MADKTLIVSVLDGVFLQLNQVGVPVPLCLLMKEQELHLKNAQWTARQTAGGFSMSFFWPVALQGVAQPEKVIKKPRWKRRKKPLKKNGSPQPVGLDNETQLHTKTTPLATPINDHHRMDIEQHQEAELSGQSESESSEYEENDKAVDLVHCEEVSLSREMALQVLTSARMVRKDGPP